MSSYYYVEAYTKIYFLPSSKTQIFYATSIKTSNKSNNNMPGNNLWRCAIIKKTYCE